MKQKLLERFVVLALVCLLGYPLLSQPAWAQEPDGTPPAGSADDRGAVDPPDPAELGEAVGAESYHPREDVVETEGETITILDLAFVASYYGTSEPAADLNLDGKVDIFDLSLLAAHYNQAGPVSGAAVIPQPAPMPAVGPGQVGDDFGAFSLPVEAETPQVESQYVIPLRPLNVGVGVNYVRIYDGMDSSSAPDPYAVVAVGNVPARTSTLFNVFEAYPNWRLGFWRYSSFPRAPYGSYEAAYYTFPMTLQIRDDDGRVCYGYYGCRDYFELADVSPFSGQRFISLNISPSNCTASDNSGNRVYGFFIDGNHCRIPLQSAGNEYPRGYVSYFLDLVWE